MRFIILPEPEKRQSLQVELIFQQLGPESSFTWPAQSHSPITQTFNRLEQHLKSGNISGPQQDFAQVRQASQNQASQIQGHRHHHYSGDEGGGNAISQRIGSAREPVELSRDNSRSKPESWREQKCSG